MSVLAALLILSNGGTKSGHAGTSYRFETFREVDKVRVADPKASGSFIADFVLAELVIATGHPILNGNKIVPDFNFLRLRSGRRRQAHLQPLCVYHGEVPTMNLHGRCPTLPARLLHSLYLPPDAPVLSEFNCRSLLFSVPWPEAESRGFTLVKEITPANIWMYNQRTAILNPDDCGH